MSIVKNAPRTATTIVVRSDANTRITHSRNPYYEGFVPAKLSPDAK